MHFEASIPPQRCSVTMCRLGFRASFELQKIGVLPKIPLTSSKANSEPTQTSKMELSQKIVKGIQQKPPSQMFDWVLNATLEPLIITPHHMLMYLHITLGSRSQPVTQIISKPVSILESNLQRSYSIHGPPSSQINRFKQ